MIAASGAERMTASSALCLELLSYSGSTYTYFLPLHFYGILCHFPGKVPFVVSEYTS